MDTSILEPLIDLSIHSTDYSRMNADGSRTEIVNRLEVVTNQLCMYIKKGDFEHASVLVKILPEDSKFDLRESLYMGFGRLLPGRNDSGRERTLHTRLLKPSRLHRPRTKW